MNVRIAITALAFVALTAVGRPSDVVPYNSPEIVKRDDERNVSLIQLIARPEDFDGKNVAVGGFLVLSDEIQSNLLVDKNSSRHGMNANGIAVETDDVPEDVQKRMRQHDRSYVYIAGRFRVGGSAFSGGRLVDVYRVELAN